MLEVACRRCERRGRLRVTKLIEQHGADMELPGARDSAGLNVIPLLRARPSRAEPPQWNSFTRHRASMEPLPCAARGHEVRTVFVDRDNLAAVQHQHQPMPSNRAAGRSGWQPKTSTSNSRSGSPRRPSGP
jgi:hypothetical protein